ncbi:MAG: molybdopterin-dependent oxidoreductase [Myxococcota bacterium]|nr:molybdopterin-dependent oxidoreductase [Myxococcota bacterium]
MADPGATRTIHSFCRICESLCGLEVDVADGRVAAIRPDPDHLASEGFACVKGLKQMRLYDAPDRLRRPLKRVGDDFVPIPWAQAFAEIGAKVRALREISPHALAMYVGTAAGFGVLHPVFAKGFMDGIGTRNFFSSSTQDCANKFAVSTHLYGFPFTLTYPDVDRTRCLIVVGANPVVSKWSFLQVADPGRRLRAIEARGGRVFVVDPRRTETAKTAGTHVFIRPNTDVFFYLAFLNELLARGGVDRDLVERHTTGFDAVARLAAPWTPERTAAVTGVPAATLREMVAAYLEATAAGGAALYCSTGVNMGAHGTLAFWIQEVVNAVSGNLDRRGGVLVGKGILDFPRLAKGNLTRAQVSRVGGFTAVNDAFPGAILADEIRTEGPERIRALFVTGGNPLITMAGAGRLREALAELDLLVVTDIFLNETASLAHYVLPATTPFERPDLPFVFPLMLGLQSRPYLQATDAVVPPAGEALDEATIYLELARASGVALFGSRAAQALVGTMQRLLGPRRREAGVREVPQRRLLSLLLRLTGHGSFARLLREPHGRPRPEPAGGDFLGARLLTDDGKLHLAPEPLQALARGLEGAFEAERAAAGELRLITKRHVKTHNSRTHNHPAFARPGQTNHLYVHPDDAARLGLVDGAVADVRSKVGAVRLPVRLLPDLMPGTVALPHGWGHQHARGLSAASRTAGVNVNLLAADGPQAVDPVSGMAHLTGIPVTVAPAAGPRDPSSWSGLPPE